jgi:hypothetical protein
MPTKRTREIQIIEPNITKDLLLSQPFGEAKFTGTATIITKEKAINVKMEA